MYMDIQCATSYDASIIRSNCFVNDVTSLMMLVTYTYIIIIRIHLSYNWLSFELITQPGRASVRFGCYIDDEDNK